MKILKSAVIQFDHLMLNDVAASLKYFHPNISLQNIFCVVVSSSMRCVKAITVAP